MLCAHRRVRRVVVSYVGGPLVGVEVVLVLALLADDAVHAKVGVADVVLVVGKEPVVIWY